MPIEASTERYRLTRVDERGWTIEDATLGSRPSQPVATLQLSEDEESDDVVVTWVSPTPLPVRYNTPEDALAEFIRWNDRAPGGTKPIPISHHPPPSR